MAAKRKAIAGVTLAKVKQEMERVPVKVPVAAASAVCGNPQPHERSGERGKKSNLQAGARVSQSDTSKPWGAISQQRLQAALRMLAEE